MDHGYNAVGIPFMVLYVFDRPFLPGVFYLINNKLSDRGWWTMIRLNRKTHHFLGERTRPQEF